MLRIRDLTVIKENRTILQSLDLNLVQGEKLVILGNSGSGKSTLLKSILYFEIPSSGEIIYNNEKLSAANIIRIRQDFAYIGQKAPTYLESVENYLLLPFHYRINRHIKRDRKSIIKELEKYSIPREILKQNYNDLSGGEQQRITIIRALMLNRSIYLLDEITSNLDTDNVEKVIINILQEQNRSLIYVTHNRKYLNRFDRALGLNDGSLHPWRNS